MEVNEEDLEALLENSSSANSKKAINYSVRIFEDLCSEKKISYDENTKDQLNEVLKKFYACCRTKKNELYSKKSLLSIRYGLQKHFEKTKQFDIVNAAEFKPANKVFGAMLVQIKKEGKGDVQHKSPLSKEDLRKLYSFFDLDSPKGLQDKVFVDFMLYFCNRGRENLRELKVSDFIIDENHNFIEMRDKMTKNHKGDVYDEKSQGGRIYKSDHILCPFASFMKYLSVLNPMCDAVFQRPKSKENLKDSNIWYDNSPLGKHTLGEKMKRLSEESGLSRSYTNHCLRATTITLLDIFEARHVMTISGHKSESSIRSYARTDDDQKQRMARRITESITGLFPYDYP